MSKVILGDSIEKVKEIDNETVHLILSDIPYGISFDEWDVLHSNTNSALLGTSPAQVSAGSIFKSRGKPLNGWSSADKNITREYYDWCIKWTPDWFRVLKPGASCFVFAGRRFAHRCIAAMEDSGFIFKDMLCWRKQAAAYRAQNVSIVFDRRNDLENALLWDGWKVGNLRPLFEPILWFMKPYPMGGTLADNIAIHGVGAFDEKALKAFCDSESDIEIYSNILKANSNKNDRGLHPTQKPLKLMQALISLVTKEGQTVLDPFCGCGTTLLAAKQLNREYIGIEINEVFFNTIISRLQN